MLEEKTKALREDILDMLYACQSGHPGGSLSCVEILTSLYYDGVMKFDPQNPKDPSRDRFVMSKGHACPAVYAVLADLGYFPKEDLKSLRQINSHLQGHPDATKTPGVDANTGSLGQGASISVGLALGAKHSGADFKVYTLIGDGECQEGLIWEAAMSAAHFKLDNLTFILDYNHLQIDGSNDEVMSLGDIVGKFKAFGFECFEVAGHDIGALTEVFKKEV
jgi:transketolase